MKILVPGATGTVGRSVVEQALSRGHDVIAVARNSRKTGDKPRATNKGRSGHS